MPAAEIPLSSTDSVQIAYEDGVIALLTGEANPYSSETQPVLYAAWVDGNTIGEPPPGLPPLSEAFQEGWATSNIHREPESSCPYETGPLRNEWLRGHKKGVA